MSGLLWLLGKQHLAEVVGQYVEYFNQGAVIKRDG
jgi:hypothetical protein